MHYVKLRIRTKEFISHGTVFDVSKHACVLVSGEDKYRHNRVIQVNNRQEKFPYWA